MEDHELIIGKSKVYNINFPKSLNIDRERNYLQENYC